MSLVAEGRLRDLLSTADRQLETKSYDAAVDTYRTALSEAASPEARAEIEERLAAATAIRDNAQRAAVLLREARYHDTAGRAIEAYNAVSQAVFLDPANDAAAQLRQQLLAANPAFAAATPIAGEPTPGPVVPVEAEPVAASVPEPLPAPPAPVAVQIPVPAPEPEPEPIEPPSFRLMEDMPPELEGPQLERYEQEPPLSILDPTPRPERRGNPGVALGLVFTFVLLIVAFSRLRPNSAPPNRTRQSVSIVTQPVALSKIDPEYTDEARAAGIEGTVILEVAVDPDGKPEVLGILRKLDPELDRRAMEAVSWWRFLPGRRNGQPVRTVTSIEVNFH